MLHVDVNPKTLEIGAPFFLGSLQGSQCTRQVNVTKC